MSSALALMMRRTSGTVKRAWWTLRPTLLFLAFAPLCADAPDNSVLLRLVADALDAEDETILLGRESGRRFRAAWILILTFPSMTMSLQEIPGPLNSVGNSGSGSDASRWQTARVLRTVYATSLHRTVSPSNNLRLNHKKNCALGMLSTRQEK